MMSMNEQLKEAFGQIRAEDQLKKKTKEFLSQKTSSVSRKQKINYRQVVPVCLCILVFVFGGHWLYFEPTAEISIDINPSVELELNRFNRVISVESYNRDGEELWESLDVKFLNYSEAVERIMKQEKIVSLLASDEIMTVSVVGDDQIQSKEILNHIKGCTNKSENIYCYYVKSEEVENAHEAGLSCGKYKVFLEIQELDPRITAKEVKNMSMKEMRDLLKELSGTDQEKPEPHEKRKRHGKCK